MALLILGFAGLAPAQGPGSGEERGSTPPGTARDGSKPAEGAITGGDAAAVPKTQAERIQRCNELSGTLREQCLLDLERGASGGTAAPDVTGGRQPPPPSAPPPQNPR